MIYHFPNFDTLRLAITSGVVPPEVSLAPAVAGEDEEGHVWLQPSVALARKAQTGLRRLGVEIVKATGDLQAEEVSCWLQMLPVAPQADAPQPTARTPVLFEFADVGLLPELVAEMLRLGNDRQSFRWLKEDKENRVLLRVVGPPYYSLLRALEREGQREAPRAYVERAPRVWVELGYTHPLVEFFKPAAGKLLLMRPPRGWLFLEEAPFQDIYDILDFKLPEAVAHWQDAPSKSRITVPLRLAPGGAADAAELWVLPEEGFDDLDTLVRDSDDHLIQRLSFAVGEREGRRSIVVRVRPSKQAPPVLVLPGRSYRAFLKLPNLFLPSGSRLQPPLRRDAVRQLLAADPDLVTWLAPRDDGGFVSESLPDTAFRPLHDWVDYVLDRDREALQTWVQAARFDFQSFVCADDGKPPAPKAPPRDRKTGKANDQTVTLEGPPPTEPPVIKKGSRRKAKEDDFAPLPQATPSELQRQLTALEKQFLESGAPLDAGERLDWWAEMASLNTALGHGADAAICWGNTLWESDAIPLDGAVLWLRAEGVSSIADLEADIERRLALADPTPSDARGLVAGIVGAVAAGTARDVLGPRLARVRQFLEKHEARIGVRATWLGWVNLASLSAGDVLGLARARDRLLGRLLGHGLNVEQDLPSFLRFSGQRSSDRFRTVREQLQRLQQLARRWIGICYGNDGNLNVGASEPTLAYVDLIFAFGLARLGEGNASRAMLASAKEVLGERGEVHSCLLQAFTYRVQQVLEGKPHGGPLPAEHLEYLADLAKRPGQDKNTGKLLAYKVDRLRSDSRILEPHERVEAYRRYHVGDDLGKELVALSDVTDRQELANGLTKLLKTAAEPRHRLQILKTALELAPRLAEAFTVDAIGQLGPTLDALPPVVDQREQADRAEVIERALFMAGHFDRAEQVQSLVTRILKLFQGQAGVNAASAIESVAGQCLRGLRKLGLRDQVELLLRNMADLLLQGRDLATQRERHKADWPKALLSLLHVAGGWLYFGMTDKALPVLQEARSWLLDPPQEIAPADRTRLACAYATALGQAPVDTALPRLAELFQQLGVLTDTYTTNDHYSRSQLQVVEAAVLAVVSDDFTLGQGTRRWLDEDEYLVRKRIHRDVRALMALGASGVA